MKNTTELLTPDSRADRIKTIVAQLAMHAQIAHETAGRSSTPFKVLLPTVMLPVFSVRDFGEGYNADELIRVFSSHDAVEDSLDGHGDLAAKAPLGYAPVFSVCSYHENMKHLCEVSVNPKTFKAVAKIIASSENNDALQPTGVDINIVVNREDNDLFKNAALDVLPHFNADLRTVLNKIDLDIPSAVAIAREHRF